MIRTISILDFEKAFDRIADSRCTDQPFLSRRVTFQILCKAQYQLFIVINSVPSKEYQHI